MEERECVFYFVDSWYSRFWQEQVSVGSLKAYYEPHCLTEEDLLSLKTLSKHPTVTKTLHQRISIALETQLNLVVQTPKK